MSDSLSLLHPAVFFDRDGTLMREVSYCKDPALVETPQGLTEALKALKAHGFLRVIVTNQSGIGRGLFTTSDFDLVQAELLRQIDHQIDATFMCPDHADTPSARRKPEPGMFLEAAKEFSIDLSRSFMIGDRGSDIQAGKNAGTATILVRTGYGNDHLNSQPDWVCDDVLSAISLILKL